MAVATVTVRAGPALQNREKLLLPFLSLQIMDYLLCLLTLLGSYIELPAYLKFASRTRSVSTSRRGGGERSRGPVPSGVLRRGLPGVLPGPCLSITGPGGLRGNLWKRPSLQATWLQPQPQERQQSWPGLWWGGRQGVVPLESPFTSAYCCPRVPGSSPGSAPSLAVTTKASLSFFLFLVDN